MWHEEVHTSNSCFVVTIHTNWKVKLQANTQKWILPEAQVETLIEN